MTSASTQTLSSPKKMEATSMGRDHSIGIAGYKVVCAPDTLRTVLGSCVGIAIYDRKAKVAALGHIILPDSTQGKGDPGKFADTAVDLLFTELVSAGASPQRLESKITGGASMFGPESKGNLGERNVEAVRERLAHHNIPLKAESVGGQKGRKMFVIPETGEVRVEIIGEKAITI